MTMFTKPLYRHAYQSNTRTPHSDLIYMGYLYHDAKLYIDSCYERRSRRRGIPEFFTFVNFIPECNDVCESDILLTKGYAKYYIYTKRTKSIL